MNHHVLHVTPSGACGPPAWQDELAARGIVVLRTDSVENAVQYRRAYPLLAILLDLEDAGPAAIRAVQTLAAAPHAGARPPMVGLLAGAATEADRRRLAEAGLNDLVARTDPESFVLWRLEILTMLEELRRFEEARTSVGELAGQTRDRLHELSQPLSAIQGRLQLLAAKANGDDPHAHEYDDLVRLVMQVSHQVMEIQQIHRRFS